jgi:hypothetical protein
MRTSEPSQAVPRSAGRAGQARPWAQGAVLLEVILALVLFVAAAAIVMSGMSASVESVERQRLNAHAMDLAVTVLSELQLGLRSSAMTGPADFEAPFKDWTCELQLLPLESDTGETSSLTRVEVIIRHKRSPLVQRLAQVMQLGQATTDRKESHAGAGP